MKTFVCRKMAPTLLCAIAAVATVSAAQYSAISGGCRAISAANCLDTRDAALVSGAFVVVETRDCETKASSNGILDLSNNLGTIIVVR